MKQYSIRQYVAYITVLPLVLLALGLGFVFYQDRAKDIENALLERGELISQQLAANSEYGVFSNNLLFLEELARSVSNQPDVRGVLILDRGGKILIQVGHISGSWKEERSRAILASNQSQEIRVYRPIVPTQIDVNTGSSTLAEPLGMVVVEVSKARTTDYKRRVLWLTLFTTAGFLLIPLLFSYRAARSVTNPIRALSQAIEAIGKGNLDTRVVLDSRIQELHTLAQGMNEMTTQLAHEHAVLQHKVDEATAELRSKKEDAERASHDKSHFLAVASHDLRQPLHALGLYVAQLQINLNGTQHQHLAEQVGLSVDALASLLNTLLDISKLDAGSILPCPHICCIDDMLKRLRADFRGMAESKHIRFIVRACPLLAFSDQILLERILMNLISNALRYTPEYGTVMVACRRRGETLRIEVRDNGVGISDKDQTQIFQEFVQLSQPQLNNNKGLGLGLSIVDRLVKLLGHKMELKSTVGKGSIFAVEVQLASVSQLQALEQKGPVLEGAGVEIRNLHGKRILVVDDDESVLFSTANLLKSWGGHVDMAASIAEVSALINQGGRWDLVISDFRLGTGQTGVEVFKLLEPYDIPSIMVSGETGDEINQIAKSGGYTLLQKPVRPAKLRSLLLFKLDEHHKNNRFD